MKQLLCPFRKFTQTQTTNHNGILITSTETTEYFQECIGDECMAYRKNIFIDYESCSLCIKN